MRQTLGLRQEIPNEDETLREICEAERQGDKFDTWAGFREYNSRRAFLLSTNPETARRLIELTQEPARGKKCEFKSVGKIPQDQVMGIAKENYGDTLRFREGFLFLIGNRGLVDIAKRNQIPVVDYSPVDDAVPYKKLNAILGVQQPKERRDERRIKLKPEVEGVQEVDVVPEQTFELSFDLRMHSFEARPFLVDEVKVLPNGCSVYLVPPNDFSRKPRWDVVLESPDGVLFHLTNGRAFLPKDLATKFYRRIGSETAFDLVREQYWETLKKFAKKPEVN